jgi:hypothetical protein
MYSRVGFELVQVGECNDTIYGLAPGDRGHRPAVPDLGQIGCKAVCNHWAVKDLGLPRQGLLRFRGQAAVNF